ncbi:LOW QUALITY PROTEIN: uncharacterized protein LOC130231264 [Danio aesculapii]|uniref:LOW QUALITY PROTEIN: uncharacterized protein LOC130231264 n=1 Tax=Danio aesculapii TaxID=1142201 RepID=UPI0024BFDFD0|nr:LOW QUALITY PROTEIN: uncharacterized protein LOC130231264 [Danio aesculapii]
MFGEERRAAPRVFCDVFSTVRHGCFPTRKNAEEVEFGRRNGSELCSGQFSFPSTHNVPWIADGSSTSSCAEHSATMRSAEFRHTFASSMPRAQKAKNKIKTQRKAKAQSRETGQSLSQTDSGQISLWPQEGASTPSVGPVRQQPLSLHPEAWIECSPHPICGNEDSAQVLEAEISSLMGKGAIRRVPVEETQTGFYSRYFLIPKKDGSLRPILDLRALNKHLRKYKFKMLTNEVFEFVTLPFGLSLAPRVFSRCMEAALSPLRHKGLRISAYLDDYLICARTRERAERDAETLSSHLTRLGFRINNAKSQLIPSQEIEYLGLRLDSNLSPSDGHDGFISVCDPTGFIKDERFSALDFREAPAPAQAPRAQGTGIHGVCDGSPPLEKPLHIPIRGSAGERVSEKSRHYGRIPNGMGSRISGQIGERSLDTPTARASHKHAGADGSFSGFKTFSTILEGFSCFSQDGQHNGGGVHQPPRGNAIVAAAQSSAQADCLERRSLELTARDARPGSQKCGGRSSVEGQPDVRRMGSPPAGGESNLGDVRQGCRRSLRLAGKRKMSAVFLSRGRGCAVGCGCAGAPVAKRAAVCIPTVKSNFSHPGQSKRKRVVSPSNSPPLAGQAVVGRDRRTSARRALAAPAATGPAVTSGGTDISPSPRTNQPLGLAREGLNLNALGLPREVISTIQSARAPSTRSLYDLKWRVFEDWCTSEGLIPFQCSVRDILCFLQSLLDNGRAFSTIKVYLAAISACHVGFEGVSVGRHPLICRFMKGVKRVRPAVKRLVPSWDLSLVLDALTRAPFEPLEDIPIKLISLKTALLLALVSAKRVGELHALSVHQACMDFSRDDDRVKLLPNPAFVPKVSDSAYNCSAIELHAFHSPPHLSAEESKLHTLCPVRALRLYVNRTRSFRRSDQLFVSWATRRKGEAVSSQRLSHWIVEAIELAYTSRGLRSPEGLRAHSSRGIATSWALFRGISVRDICKAASWSSPHTFIRFYRLDVTAPSLAHAVLNVCPL